ncbi:alkaline phosphatase family protein [Dokdonella soli]|uniref:Phosphoesterase n=1 Tax=Dokdonella soli TaxID=529810 RepID=A0ABN1IZV8_9GAMM
MNMLARLVFTCSAGALALGGCASTSTPKTAVGPRVGHVFVIVLENEPFERTFGKDSPAPYLAHELTAKGALLRQYFGIGHNSLDNYVAMISGQAPNAATQADCPVMREFSASAPGLDTDGQLHGEGCVYPGSVKTVADQLEAAHFDWRGYMEDMGKDPAREAAACGHVAIGAKDVTNHAAPNDQYADKHNPFIYFHSIIDDRPRCERHVVNLDALPHDLQDAAATPNYVFITPSLCHDGHDLPCKNGEPGGLESADAFLRSWVPRILDSAAFKQDGLLVITFDEGILDSTACCGEHALAGGPPPGLNGPGGGRIGAVLIAPSIRPGTLSDVPYNHYSLLRWVEDDFHLTHLGYAAAPGLATFGSDVFAKP